MLWITLPDFIFPDFIRTDLILDGLNSALKQGAEKRDKIIPRPSSLVPHPSSLVPRPSSLVLLHVLLHIVVFGQNQDIW